MRIYTLVFSVIAHVIAIAMMIIMPALATDVLPEPPRTTAYIVVRPVPPDVPPVIRRAAAAPSRNAAPTEPPAEIRAEPIAALDQPAFDVPASTLSGVAAVGDVGGADVIQAPPLPLAPAQPKEPVRTGGVIQTPKKLVSVAPVYPPLALASRHEGLVILEALLAEDGTVRDVKVLRSDRLLDDAAIAAVRQWRFTPTLLNGEPVPVVMTVTVTFSLNK